VYPISSDLSQPRSELKYHFSVGKRAGVGNRIIGRSQRLIIEEGRDLAIIIRSERCQCEVANKTPVFR